MKKPVELALIGAGNRGARAYGDALMDYPAEGKYVAVAEPNEVRREKLARRFHIPKERCFENWRDMLARPLLAPALVNATQDAMHVESTLAALEAGYHVLLEKPMALTPQDCLALTNKAAEKDRILQICHVLRFSRANKRVKQLIDHGKIGEIVHIAHAESVGFWHFAHSYVRGHWRRKDESSFLMLTKSCHDTDLLGWLINRPASRLSSFGSLKVFRPENAPEGATDRCTGGCAVEKHCPYSAKKLYLDPGRPPIPLHLTMGVSLNTILRAVSDPRGMSLGSQVFDDLSDAGVRRALETGPYGRCVYHCDNDVVDHQVLNLEFEGGATAAFSLNAFTQLSERTTRITGTDGEIRLADFKGQLELRRFSKGSSEFEYIPFEGFSHGGGDTGLIRDFLANVRHAGSREILTSAQQSLQSHLIAFASEESRLAGGRVIHLNKFQAKIQTQLDKKAKVKPKAKTKKPRR